MIRLYQNVLCALVLLLLGGGCALGSVLVADNTMSRMVELTSRAPFCAYHSDRGRIRDMLLSADPRRVRQMSDGAIDKLVAVCRSDQVHNGHQGGFIYPGTLWCGPGTAARNHSELGTLRREDICCREHDNCPQSLAAGECARGICNDSPFTRSHCDCDAKFRRCLQNVNTETANTIGAIFFNVVQVICFKERTPCSQWQSNDTNPDQCQFEFAESDRYQSHIAAPNQIQNGPSYRFPLNHKTFFLNLLWRKFCFLLSTKFRFISKTNMFK